MFLVSLIFGLAIEEYVTSNYTDNYLCYEESTKVSFARVILSSM